MTTPGTISRFQIQSMGSFVFTMLGNGNEAAYGIVQGALGDLDYAYYIRWAWDDNFTSVGFGVLSSAESDLVNDILTTGNLWNNDIPGTTTTWTAVLNGASYTSVPNGNQVLTGQNGVNQALADWLSAQTVETCEASTDVELFKGLILVKMQMQLNSIYGALVTPAAPTPVSPTSLFPAQTVGLIKSATGLMIAQATRLSGSASGNIPVVSALPVPTT